MNNIENIKFELPLTSLVIGSPKAGKTTLIKYIISQLSTSKDIYKKINYIFLFSKTQFKHSFDDIIPTQWQYPNYNGNVIKKIMNVQAAYYNKGKKPPSCALIFDDCIDTKIFQTDLFNELIMNYRHYNISVIIAAQYLKKAISTTIRECVKQAFIFDLNTHQSFVGAYEAFFGQMKNVNELKKYFQENLTEKYLFVYVDNENTGSTKHFVSKAPANFKKRKIKYIKSIPISKLKNHIRGS